ncbi:hypothetical protein Q31a_48470 [Aureliella helgolandensis]|uniref:Uncharacterized protein n=1 Tax=Aureliella helgolandensis TaxID=2527968 RepID=A0A518GD15_9BACT|nr:hypothetical protein Q31a_48470 [Aureliella helgolandensis]
MRQSPSRDGPRRLAAVLAKFRRFQNLASGIAQCRGVQRVAVALANCKPELLDAFLSSFTLSLGLKSSSILLEKLKLSC